MQSILSITATIISSIALIGVAAGLILQSRQLKASHVQIMREMHLEIIKVGIENPALIASIYEMQYNASDAPKAAYINLLINFWQTCYSLETMTSEAVALEAENLLVGSEFARNWWKRARIIIQAESQAERDKEFHKIVDSTFQNIMQTLPVAAPVSVNSQASKSSGRRAFMFFGKRFS